MSLLEKVESETGDSEIEPGKRLIRVGDDRGLSLFERLNYRLHRFAWRTPLHKLRLRGRVPLKLIAVPKDPIAGDKAAGEALLHGIFRHGGTEMPVEGLDFVDARACRRISAPICRASPGCATFPPRRRASAAPSSPKRSCANGLRSMPSRSASRPGAPICGAAESCSGPPTRPTSCRAPTRSIAPGSSTHWRAARATSSEARTRRSTVSPESPPGAG